MILNSLANLIALRSSAIYSWQSTSCRNVIHAT